MEVKHSWVFNPATSARLQKSRGQDKPKQHQRPASVLLFVRATTATINQVLLSAVT